MVAVEVAIAHRGPETLRDGRGSRIEGGWGTRPRHSMQNHVICQKSIFRLGWRSPRFPFEMLPLGYADAAASYLLGIEPAAQPLVGALDHLQRLAQIVCCHAPENCVKVASALQVEFVR